MQDEFSTLFNLSSLDHLSVNVDDKSVFMEGVLRTANVCPRCTSHHVHRRTKNHRLLRLPPVAGKSAALQVLVQKRRCVDCKHGWWPSVPFANGKERITHSFTTYALELLKFGTIKDVSRHLGVGWDLIKGIHKSYLQNRYMEIDMSKVEYVSIDEFSIAKRHKYMTTVMDIATGRILYAIEGRKKDDIAPILRELKKKHPALKPLPWT